MNKRDFQKYIIDVYGESPDFPWESNPTFAVYRHSNNRKWFALLMDNPKLRLARGRYYRYCQSQMRPGADWFAAIGKGHLSSLSHEQRFLSHTTNRTRPCQMEKPEADGEGYIRLWDSGLMEQCRRYFWLRR